MRIAVTGMGGRTGQGILRALRQGVPGAWILGLDASPLAAGLYGCDAAALVPPARGEAAFLAGLEALVARHRIQLLLPGLDPELPVLAGARGRLEALGCQVVVSEPGIVATCQDKLACCRWLRGEGEPFARSWSLAELMDVAQPAFPLFLKPVVGSGSKFLKVAFSRQDLLSVPNPGEYVAQEFLLPVGWGIPSLGEMKPEHVWKNGQLRQEDDLSVQGLLDPGGELVGLAVLLKEFFAGMSIKAVPFRHEEVEAVSASIFRRMGRLGARGSCNLQGRLTAQGFRVYELNPRLSGATAIRAALGFNECRAIVDLWLGGRTREEVAGGLRLAEDQLCLRYLTECIVPLSRVEEVRQNLQGPRGA